MKSRQYWRGFSFVVGRPIPQAKRCRPPEQIKAYTETLDQFRARLILRNASGNPSKQQQIQDRPRKLDTAAKTERWLWSKDWMSPKPR